MNKTIRDKVYAKYNGNCAYSGTPLDKDWQVDHINPKRLYDYGMFSGDPDCIDNLVPAQRLINHYKRALPLDDFRNKWLGGLHKRLAKLPKNPKTVKGQNRKNYLLDIAAYFEITPDKPFSGVFYFEMQDGE